MLQKIREYVKAYNMLEKQQNIVFGLSGGADSICLALVLKTLQQEYGYALKAVHVNHGIRGDEADGDETFCRGFCEKNKIQLIVVRKDVPNLAIKWHMSLEEAGRKVRYEAFEEALGNEGGRIAVAHHKNDNAETVLFNMVRGSDIIGMSGIKPVNGRIIRPLLAADRCEIEAFLRERGQEYCTDSTNIDNEYSRNLLRNRVLPMLENINAGAVDNICAAAARLAQISQLMERLTREASEKCVFYSENSSNVTCEINLEIFYKCDRIIQENILYDAICRCAKAKKDIERLHVNALVQLAYNTTGRQLDLPYKLSAVKEYGRLYIFSKENGMPEYGLDWKMHICRSRRELEEFIRNHKKEFIEKKFCTKEVNCGKIKNNLILRSRQPKDYITVGSDGMRKSVRRFFIDEKVPQSMRNMPMVFDGNEAVWIIGHRFNKRYAADDKTDSVIVVIYGKNIECDDVLDFKTPD